MKTVLYNYLAIGSIILATAAASPSQGQVIVIAPVSLGFHSAFEIIANSGGSIVREGSSASLAIGHSIDPDFTTRLYREGALLVLNSHFLSPCNRT